MTRKFLLLVLVTAMGLSPLAFEPWNRVAAVTSSPSREPALPSCDVETALKMKNEDPPNMQCMQFHAWTIVTTKLLDLGEPIWYDWCAMTVENGRTLNCPSLESIHSSSFAAKETVEMRHKKGVKQFFDSFGELRQISMIPSLNTSNLQRNKIGFERSDSTEQDTSIAPPRSLLFETSQVLFNLASRDVIADCFSDQLSTASQGTTKIHLSSPQAAIHKCTEDEVKAKMSDDMIAIKPVWAVTEESNIANISYPIPVWVDSNSPGHGPRATALEGKPGALKSPAFNQWETQVSLILPLPSASEGAKCDVMRDFPPSPFPDEPKVPLSCFYSLTITIKQWNELLKASHLSPHQTTTDGDKETIYLILMGFHVITREIPDWTWQTFWWDWKAGSDPQSPYQKRQSADVRWAHYHSSVTYGPPDHAPDDYKDLQVFNPYLEGVLPNGLHSNCLKCHSFASYHSERPLDRFLEGQFLGTGVCKSAILPTSISTGCDPNEFHSTGFNTHLLWSVADTNVNPEGPNLHGPLDRVRELDRFLTSLEADRDEKRNISKNKKAR